MSNSSSEILMAQPPPQQIDDEPERQRGKPKKRQEKSMPKKKLMRERQRAREIHRDALRSTRDTITLVAVLIATFAYNAGISPPGGVHQDGPLIGTSVAARRTAFRVFLVCNNVALFTSLCVVLVLVSIIPFKRKALMRMLAIAHKAIWVAVSFMATAYVAAAAAIMQPPSWRRGLDWTTVFFVSICGGSLGTVFVGLGILLIKHQLVKRKWRKQKQRRRERRPERERENTLAEEYRQEEREKPPLEENRQEDREKPPSAGPGTPVEASDADDDSLSSNSDIDVSDEWGYHSY